MVKRFIVLQGCSYYPEGWQDFKGSFDTLAECKELLVNLLEPGPYSPWYEVVDTQEKILYYNYVGRNENDFYNRDDRYNIPGIDKREFLEVKSL